MGEARHSAAADDETVDTGDRAAEGYVRFKPGDVLSGFRIEQEIGSGGMGVVYRATQLSLNRPVALKILPRKYSQNPSFVRQFDGETAMLASLNHPNIISIIDRGRAADTCFYAMEYVQGTTLKNMTSPRRMSIELFLRTFRQAAEALRYMHSKGIIHRDIKLGNIMLDENSNVKIADFGLARLMAEGEEGAGGKRHVAGTPGYMAPEQELDPNRADERSDIFSLGAVMYRVLTGKLPESLPPPPPSQVRGDVDAQLDQLVLKCLRRDPQERYQSAAEFLSALGAYQEELTRLHKVCPYCKAQNPIEEEVCLGCGADLFGLLGQCPRCGASSAPTAQACEGCGVNLKDAHREAASAIHKGVERARALAAAKNHKGAVGELRGVLEVKGSLYEHARSEASGLIERYEAERRAPYLEAVEQGRALAVEGDLVRAIELYRTVPPEMFAEIPADQYIRDAEEKIAAAKERLQHATGLLDQERLDEAEEVLEWVAATWRDCPGLRDAQYRLQALQQTREMIKEELKVVDRLVELGDFEQARASLGALARSAPRRPEIERKAREIDQREQKHRLEALLQEAKSAEEKGQYLRASQTWKQAADLAAGEQAQKAALLAKARRAREHARAEEILEPFGPEELPESQPVVKLSARRGRRAKMALLYLLVALGAAVVIAVGLGLYRRQAPPEETGGGRIVPGSGQQAGPGQEGQPVPEGVLPQAVGGAKEYFLENFDEGTADNWQYPAGRWLPAPVERRTLRAFAEDGEAVALHKFYQQQDCGVEAWVRMDVAGRADSSVSLSVRKQDGSELALRVTRGTQAAVAKFAAFVDGRPVAEGETVELPGSAGMLFEGTLRIDALGDRALARVDGAAVGVLSGLPAELVRPGKAALHAAYCRASWDDVRLDKAVPENLAPGEIMKSPQETLTGPGEKPPEQPQLPTVADVKPDPAVQAVALGNHSLRMLQSFDTNGAGWKAEAGAWQRMAQRYGFSEAGSGASFLTLGQFADVEIKAAASAGGAGEDSAGKSFGLLARYQDERNYIFFGLTGTGGAGWAVELITCVEGRQQTVTAPGGPYRLGEGGDLALMLGAVGSRACGYVGGRPVVSAQDVLALAPAGGKLGVRISGLVASFDALQVRAVQPAVRRGGEAWTGGVRLEIAEGIEAEPAEPPALIRLRECKGRYLFLEGLESGVGTMSVTARLEGLRAYPQFSLCGAAKGQRAEMAAQLADFYGRGRVEVRLVAVVPDRGALATRSYAQRKLTGVEISAPIEFTLALRPDGIECLIGGQRVAGKTRDGMLLPAEPGKWGFRSTDMIATIERIELEL